MGTSGAGGNVGRRSHPLLQTLVTYEIMKHLPRSDVLNCRLVCATWDIEVCRLLRKRLTLDFDDLCQVNKFHALLDKSEEIKGERDLPFAKIHLRPSFRLGHSLAQEFFKTHGHIIRHLTILKVGCDCGANFFQKLLFYQATNLSSLNLQIIGAPIRLSPESGYSWGKTRAIECPPTASLELPHLRHLHLRHQLFIERTPFIKELLMAAINLEYLTTDTASPEFCSEIFLPIVLNCPNSWAKLKKLSCGTSLTLSNQQLEEFCSRKFRLIEISLLFHHNSTEEPMNKDGLQMLLKHNQETCKHLELNNRQADVSFELDCMPKMPHLEKLRLTNVSLEPKWLEMLPRLSCFEFFEEDRSGLCIPLTNLNSSLILNYPSMSHLVLSPMCILNIRDLNDMGLWWDVNGHLYIRKLADAFPKLKSISLNGNDAILKAIYDHLPLLEGLSIHGPVTDEGLTGIQLDICEMMHFEQSYHSVNFNVLPVAKFIGDLQRLKKLVIVPPLKSTLTEVSIFFGLVCCKDLTHLELNSQSLMKLWREELDRKKQSSEPS